MKTGVVRSYTVLTILAILFGLTILSEKLLYHGIENIQGVQIIRLLAKVSTNKSIEVVAFDERKHGSCLAYLEYLLIAQSRRNTDTASAIKSIEQAQMCLTIGRGQLLMPMKGELLAKLGQYTESCDVLSSVNQKSSLLILAESAQQRGDWPVVISFLSCIEHLRQNPGWIASNRVSDLYWNLGLQHEENGRIEDALTAYSRASDWYPYVLPAPVIRKARLLMQIGKQSEAKQVILDTLSKAVERTTVFALLVEMGKIWDSEGKVPYAYCAYLEAESLIPSLPESYDRDNLLADLEARKNRLQTAQLSKEIDCDELLSTWLISPSP